MEEDQHSDELTPDEQEKARRIEGQIKTLVREYVVDGKVIREDIDGNLIAITKDVDPQPGDPEYRFTYNIYGPNRSTVFNQFINFYSGSSTIQNQRINQERFSQEDEVMLPRAAKPEELENLRMVLINSKTRLES